MVDDHYTPEFLEKARIAGETLVTARNAEGLKPEDVANQLRMRPELIAALEAGRCEGLRGPVFVRGYYQAYARLLAVSIDLQVAENSELPATDVSPIPILKHVEERPQLFANLGKASVAFAFCLGIYGLWQYGGEDVSQQQVADRPLMVVDRNDQAVIEQLRRRDEAMQSVSENGAQPLMQSELTLDTGAVSSVIPASLEANSDALTVSFSGDCWLEVKDAENRVLVAELKHADDKLVLRGKAPFNILLGFAPAAKLHYNGEPVEIASVSRNNSARIIVGKS